jgi:hypothetical protein
MIFQGSCVTLYGQRHITSAGARDRELPVIKPTPTSVAIKAQSGEQMASSVPVNLVSSVSLVRQAAKAVFLEGGTRQDINSIQPDF